MTDQQRKWIQELTRCTFQPGSWEKRFVRDLAALSPYDVLTERQAAALHRTAYRYRKQRGNPGMPRPDDPLLSSRDDVAAAYDALDAWNKGEPIR